MDNGLKYCEQNRHRTPYTLAICPCKRQKTLGHPSSKKRFPDRLGAKQQTTLIYTYMIFIYSVCVRYFFIDVVYDFPPFVFRFY